MHPIFSFLQTTFQQGNVPVLHHLDWSVQADEQWAIVGPVGSGKTMLLTAIQQQLKGQAALVAFRESSRQLNYSDYFYQQRYHAAVEDNAPLLRTFLFGNHLPDADALAILAQLGLTPLLDLAMIKLSNGQTRKALIARALLNHPHLLLLDDPFIGLDTPFRAQLMHWLDQLMQTGMQLVLVTQPDALPEYITHVLELDNGRIVWQGSRSAFKHRQADQPTTLTLPFLQTKPIRPDFSIAFALDNVTVRYGNKLLLDAINWTVKRGEKWALLGHNGAGKSVLLSLLYGDHPQAYANRIHLFDRRRGRGESIWDIKRRIGFVSPELHLYFPRHLTAYQVALTGLTDTQTVPRQIQSDAEHDIQALFAYFGLEVILSRSFGTLSAGQQRLILLIRALLKQAPCLILDEPFQCLDQRTMQQAKHLINQLSAETTLLFVTHYMHEIPSSVDKVLELREGKILRVSN